MTIQLIDGFDQAPGATDVKATVVSFGYTFSGAGAPAWATGRAEGSQALLLSQNDKRVGLERTFAIRNGALAIGFSVFATERARLLSFNGSALVLDWRDDGLHLGTQVSVAKPIRNRWYYIEVLLKQGTLEADLYINGEYDITAVLPDALGKATSVDVMFAGYNPTNATGKPAPTDGTLVPSDIRIDDLYAADGEGHDDPTAALLGAVEVLTRFPSADVVTEFSTATPDAPHWQEVTQLPPSDKHFITSYKTGARDLFTSDKAIPADATIKAAALTFYARKGDVDDRAMGMIIGNDDPVEQVVKDLTLDSRYYTRIFDVDAQGNAWTPETLNDAPFGVAVR